MAFQIIYRNFQSHNRSFMNLPGLAPRKIARMLATVPRMVHAEVAAFQSNRHPNQPICLILNRFLAHRHSLYGFPPRNQLPSQHDKFPGHPATCPVPLCSYWCNSSFEWAVPSPQLSVSANGFAKGDLDVKHIVPGFQPHFWLHIISAQESRITVATKKNVAVLVSNLVNEGRRDSHFS